MQYPDLAIIVNAICDAIVATAGLVAHQGIFSLFKYLSDLSALGSLTMDEVKVELAKLTPEERAALEDIAKQKFANVPQAGLQAKLESGVDLLELVIQYGVQLYGQYQQGVKLFEEIKALVTQ